MTKRVAYFIPVLLFVALVGAGCARTQIQTTTTTNPVVGGDRDEHGCIGSAGYRWCEPKQACLRFWETPCYASAEEGIKAALAEELKLKPADIFVKIAEITSTHAKGSVGKVGEEKGPAGMFLASQGNNIWLVDYHGNGQADCALLKERGYPTSMLNGVCD